MSISSMATKQKKWFIRPEVQLALHQAQVTGELHPAPGPGERRGAAAGRNASCPGKMPCSALLLTPRRELRQPCRNGVGEGPAAHIHRPHRLRRFPQTVLLGTPTLSLHPPPTGCCCLVPLSWYPGLRHHQAGLGPQGKLRPPLHCPPTRRVLHPAYVSGAGTAWLCQLLETRLAGEQSKASQPESNSSPFLQKAPRRAGGCSSTPGGGGEPNVFFLPFPFTKRQLLNPAPQCRGPEVTGRKGCGA